MATARITVPLTDEAYEAISLISSITGVSRGRLLADVLETAVPAFLAIAQAYTLAQDVDAKERHAINRNMQDAADQLIAAFLKADFTGLAPEPPALVPSGASAGGAEDVRSNTAHLSHFGHSDD